MQATVHKHTHHTSEHITKKKVKYPLDANSDQIFKIQIRHRKG